jgi:hypothetical protein
MKFKTYLIALLCISLFACQEDDQQFGELRAPSNLNITAEVVGADAENPFGDGSGEVRFNVTATNAISYAFIFNGNKKNSPSGSNFFIFSTLGVNTYTVTAVAYGTGGISTSETIEVEVLAEYEPPEELLTKLYGFDPENPDAFKSKTWRIKNEVPGHFGLGPVGGQIPVEFFGVGVNEKVGVGMYDDRYIFNSDRTFEVITNVNNDDETGTVFGRVNLIDELGGTGSGTANGADIENYPYSDFQETWQLIEPGGIETISLSGVGFIGYYTGGDHNYEIFDRSVPNELLLKTTDGNGEFDWWFIITSEPAP